jgi:hypothetical protein
MSEFNIAFYSREYWEEYYKENGFDSLGDWYFEFQKVKLKDFSLESFEKTSETMLIGVGCSSLIDYLIELQFKHVTLVDFSRTLIDHLKLTYENRRNCEEWDCKYK